MCKTTIYVQKYHTCVIKVLLDAWYGVLHMCTSNVYDIPKLKHALTLPKLEHAICVKELLCWKRDATGHYLDSTLESSSNAVVKQQ